MLAGEKKHAEAESVAREGLAIRRKLHGNEHLAVADSLLRLAGILNNPGKRAEAEALAREALAMSRKLTGDSPVIDVANSLETLANVLRSEDKLVEAEATAREALDLSVKLTGKGSSWNVPSLYYLVDILAREGKHDELEQVFNEFPIPSKGNPGQRAKLAQWREEFFAPPPTKEKSQTEP